MEITDVRAVVVGKPWKDWVFVIVETDEGITGLGEVTGGLQTGSTFFNFKCVHDRRTGSP